MSKSLGNGEVWGQGRGVKGGADDEQEPCGTVRNRLISLPKLHSRAAARPTFPPCTRSLLPSAVVDPVETIGQYGADALRWTLATGTAPGQDLNLSLDRVNASRNFTNKLWQAGKFLLFNLDKVGGGGGRRGAGGCRREAGRAPPVVFDLEGEAARGEQRARLGRWPGGCRLRPGAHAGAGRAAGVACTCPQHAVCWLCNTTSPAAPAASSILSDSCPSLTSLPSLSPPCCCSHAG